ncbi:hypothetical protein ACHQM5_028489 [Ranunculus cassubicifolius]
MEPTLTYRPGSANLGVDTVIERRPIESHPIESHPTKMDPLSAIMGELNIRGTECGFCLRYHLATPFNHLKSVPKNAIVCPYMSIVCWDCGWEMKNDLQCPRCKREKLGKLVPKHCDHCWDLALAHTSESCPNKGATFMPEPEWEVTDEFLARVSNWQPSSP